MESICSGTLMKGRKRILHTLENLLLTLETFLDFFLEIQITRPDPKTKRLNKEF